MKHAIVMTVHNNQEVTKTLMSILDDSRFEFFILVDKKSLLKNEDFVPQNFHRQVNFLDRMEINWGGYSQIEAMLQLIDAAKGFDYIHYSQGADLPLKTPNEIDEYFEKNRYEYISLDPKGSEFGKYKVLCKHFFADNRWFRTNKLVKIANHGFAHLQKPFMPKETIYEGSALFSISGKFAEYVRSNMNDIRKRYKLSLAADECFLQCLLMDSPFIDKHSPGFKDARFIDWKNHEGNSPKTFTMSDVHEIDEAINNPDLIFARKFSADRDMEIVNYIKSQLIRKSVKFKLSKMGLRV